MMLFFAVSEDALGQRHTCKLTIGVNEWQVNGRINASMVKPGDTICLEAGQRQFLWLSYLHGTSSRPIVVINNSGVVEIIGHFRPHPQLGFYVPLASVRTRFRHRRI